MKKLLRWAFPNKNKKKRVLVNEGGWMRDQLARMGKMNQGIITMALGKD